MRKNSSVESFESFESMFDKFWTKSQDLYSKIDAWHAHIYSFVSLNFNQKAISFSDTHQYLELLNFLWGEYDLLYHGEIKSVENEVLLRSVGYNHDNLRAIHLTDILDKIAALKRVKKTSAQKDKYAIIKSQYEIIELSLIPKGHLLADGAVILKGLFSEFDSILEKHKIGFSIVMKETSAHTPFVFSISDPDTKPPLVLKRNQAINFEKKLADHPWFPSKKVQIDQPAFKKKKIEQVEKVGPMDISKTVQTTEAMKERRKRNVVESSPEPEESPPKPLESISLQPIEVKSQHLNFDSEEASDIVKTHSLKPQHPAYSPLEILPFQTSYCSSVAVFPFSNRHALSIVRGDKANTRLELKNMVQQYLVSEEENDRSNFENAVYSIKMFSELRWSFQEFLISFEEMVLTLRKKLIEEANDGKSHRDVVLVALPVSTPNLPVSVWYLFGKIETYQL